MATERLLQLLTALLTAQGSVMLGMSSGKSDIAAAYDRGSSTQRLRHGSLQLVLPSRIYCQLGRGLCGIDFDL